MLTIRRFEERAAQGSSDLDAGGPGSVNGFESVRDHRVEDSGCESEAGGHEGGPAEAESKVY